MKKGTGKMVPYMMGMLVKKNATTKYPAVPAELPPNFRGALKFDQDSCIGCKMCERVCPADAIKIIKVEGEEKKFRARMHLDRCIFCAQCVDSCPKHSLHNTDRFELATLDKSTLEVDI